MDKHVDNYLAEKIKKDGELYTQAKQLYLDGMSMTVIQQKLGYNRKRLSTLLKYEGIDIKQNNQKHEYNTIAFNNIDIEEKAYWLGFLYADGDISIMNQSQLRVSLKCTDKEHLIRLKNFLCPTAYVNEYDASETVTQTIHKSVRVSFFNKKIVQDLISHGCYPDKGTIVSIPFEDIPEKLIRHFIRGFFDGDGCSCIISKSGQVCISFLSTSKDIISQIQNILCDIGIKRNKFCEYKREGHKTLYTFYNSANKDLKLFYNYIYNRSTICLERKKNIIKNRITSITR